jgi:DNA-binding NarL/FixJ family response regulator
MDARPWEHLSNREVDILEQLSLGHSNKTIASRLQICEGTVKVHMKNIFRKIGTDNRVQAAIWAALWITSFKRSRALQAQSLSAPTCQLEGP